MVTSDRGACEWLVWDIQRSNLVDAERLDAEVADFLQEQPGAEPPALAEHLVQKGMLTRFHVDRLLQGKTRGFVLGPYTLMDVLGTGSLGTVYKAHAKTDNGWYAVKSVPRRSMWNVRLARRKIKAFEGCQHPAVVPFVDIGTSGGTHYLAWPLAEGESLDKVVARQGKLPAPVVARFALQTAEGLDLCHRQGLIHGLLKPSNLLVGADEQIRILDFGIGCLLAEADEESLVDTMSTANAVTSGLDCASPESILDPRNLTAPGDQYSLGCVLYFALTGQFPFADGSAAEKMMAHQFREPTPLSQINPDVPAEMTAIVERLMKKKPEERFVSMADAVIALRKVAPEAPAGSAGVRRWVAPAESTPLPEMLKKMAAREPAAQELTPRASAPQTQQLHDAPRHDPLARELDKAQRRTSAPQAAAKSDKPQALARSPFPDLPEDDDPDVIPRQSWEERLGPLGLTLASATAGTMVWLLAAWLKLF
jgi:serine/threonine-protein kinase